MDQQHITEQEHSIEKIELRSNEVQEILSRPPKWIVRWGISVLFFVIIVILVGSWFFEYPDIIGAKVVLTTENPPAPLIAKSSGKIQNLFVQNNENVSKDQVIAIIENPAQYESIQALNNQLDLFKIKFNSGKTFDYLIKEGLQLGSIQTAYGQFYKNISEYNQMIRLNYHDQKVALYRQEIQKYNLYLNNLTVQSNLLKDDLELTQNQFNRDSVLYNQNLVSNTSFEKSKSQLIAKKYNLEQVNSSISSVNLQIEGLKQNILELELQKQKQLSDYESVIKQSFEALVAVKRAWEYQYVLVSPTTGKVTFNQFWNENQSVSSGDVVMTIIPENEGEIIGKAQLSFDGAGKVKIGQHANIQFSNYPYMEFGMVEGIVKSISLAPNNNYYTAEIELPNGLKTFYGIDLEFKQEMQGSAEIITEDIRLLERIVRPLRYILKKNTKFGGS